MRLFKRSHVSGSSRALAVVVTTVIVPLAGCPAADDTEDTVAMTATMTMTMTGPTTDSQTGGPTTDSGTGSDTDPTDPSSGTETTDPSETATDSSETATETGTPSGIGCGITPECTGAESDASPFELKTADQIEEIAGVRKIFGSLEINASEFECLDFLACLEEVGGSIQVFDNELLMDMSGLDGVTTVGSEFPNFASITIADNSALVDMNGLNGVQQVPVSLTINRNEAMTSVSGLSGLVVIQEDMTIRDNPVLNGLSGLHGLKAVGGKFLITQNPMQCISEVNQIGGGLKQWSGEGATDANDDSC